MISLSDRAEANSLGRTVVRSLGWILGGALLGFIVVFVVLQSGRDDRDEVRALVVAEELVIGVDELPASVGAIYRGGGVGARAVADAGLQIDASELTGDRVDVVVIASTPVIEVVGRDDDPAQAVVFANAVAASLATELTEARGLGVFRVIEDAEAASAEPPSGAPVAVLSLLGAVIGALVGFALRLALRSPVYALAELAAVSRAPLMDEVTESGAKVPAFATYLLSSPHGWRLVHCGSGTDHTAELVALFETACPGLRVSWDDPSSVEPPPWMDGTEKTIVVVPDGAAARAVRSAERVAGLRLGATLFVRRDRRGDDER